MSRPQRTLIRFAIIGALALALPLAGCGRKGALDPPPGGYVLEQGTVKTAVSRRGAAAPRSDDKAPDKSPEYDDEGKPIAPQGVKKRLPGDWLID